MPHKTFVEESSSVLENDLNLNLVSKAAKESGSLIPAGPFFKGQMSPSNIDASILQARQIFEQTSFLSHSMLRQIKTKSHTQSQRSP